VGENEVQTYLDETYYTQAEESLTDKVVYLLGAGFSAPLGLPVMSDFLIKSKDLYFSDPQRFRTFQEVFNTIAEMSVSKNYYDADLFNIEEILSILEMHELVGSGQLKSDFVQYIIDVIEHYTPPVRDRHESLPGNWHDFLFSGGNLQSEYRYFVGNLIGLRFERPPNSAGTFYQKLPRPSTSYSVITLNYDMVIESYAQYVERNHAKLYANDEEDLRFHLGPDPAKVRTRQVSLAKLHGSVNTGVVVPPTWNKVLNESLLASWKLAFELLAEANHIRIIGYSLPTADAYVKYLLKAAVIHAPHLKSIDVLCLDNTGEVRERYERFVEFDRFRFCPGSVVDYLGTHYGMYTSSTLSYETPATMDKLEDAHEEFFALCEHE
jgi:hypothetical protein